LKLKNIFQSEFIETSKTTSFWILVPITQKINSPIKVQIRSKTLEIFFGKSSDYKIELLADASWIKKVNSPPIAESPVRKTKWQRSDTSQTKLEQKLCSSLQKASKFDCGLQLFH
jgi:hypothetical protein